MKLLDLTLSTAAENLALDEALLDAAEAVPGADEVLRLWEPTCHFVVLGRSSQIDAEVNLAACRRRGIAVLRRSSGGAAIVAGPGCLVYSLVLDYRRRPELRPLDQAHEFVLSQVARALRRRGLAAGRRGTSDLALGERKISGNSLRCKRDNFLYHGTILYDFDLSLLDDLLRLPPRQPEYRGGRRHGEFVMNVPVDADALRTAITEVFAAREPLTDWPRALTAKLLAARYSRDAWNLRA
jgi:lipoate-protein ligase A